MEVCSATKVAEIIKSARECLRKLSDGSQGGNLFEWVGQQEEVLFDIVKRNSEKKRNELFQRVHKKLFDDIEKKGGEKIKKLMNMSQKEAIYWIERRPIPVVTEEDVDKALEQLTEDEHMRLLAEFDVQHNAEFEKLEINDTIPAVKNNSRIIVNTETAYYNDNDDFSVIDFGKSDGKSIIFGKNLLELTYERDMWITDTKSRDKSQINGHCRKEIFDVPNFETTVTYNMEKNVPCITHSHPHMSNSSPSSPPSCSLNKPSLETLRENYIRDRIRMLLVANDVVKDIEGTILDHVLTVVGEWVSERDASLKALLNQQMEYLQEAMQVMQSVQMLDHQVMAAYVKDSYYRQAWQRDETARNCRKCHCVFTYGVKHHHCRRCGFIFCNACSSYSGILPDVEGRLYTKPSWLRLCQDCYEICCKHQRNVIESQPIPRGSYARDTLAPDDPSLIVLSGCSHSNGTLEDNLPPFYVVLPEEWYTVKQITFSGWINSLKYVPYTFFESVQSAISSLSGVAVPRVYQMITGGVELNEKRNGRNK